MATGTNWVFRDESAHIAFAFSVIATVRREQPDLFDESMEADVVAMIREAVDCEAAFAQDVLSQGVVGMSHRDPRKYLEYVADRRLESLALRPVHGSRDPFAFMELQDVREPRTLLSVAIRPTRLA